LVTEPAVSYDELWRREWGDMQRYGPVHRHNMRRLVEMVRRLSVRRILDVGCGSGDNLAALAASGDYELSGVDVSEAALRLAAERLPSARFERLDVEKHALANKFDLVISIQVIEHLMDDIAALRNMARMSRQYVFVSTVSGRMRHSELAIGHVRNYSDVELEAKLRAAGLRSIEIERWGFPFYSPLYRSVAEWLPGGPPAGPMNRLSRLASNALYQLYRLNLPRHGDVITALAMIG
jgi:SAM-dependent methyltransferase